MIIKRFRQVLVLIKLLLAYVLSFFIKRKNIWLISERGTEARDNGYWLFCFIKTNHPEIDVRFIVSKYSEDRKKLNDYQQSLITYRSFKHYVYLINASYLISTHLQGYYPDVLLFRSIDKRLHLFSGKKHISLKHGITKDYLPSLMYENTRLDLIICGAYPEYIYMKNTFHYPDSAIKYTGFCRFDGLYNYVTKKQILIMPTWRSWIQNDLFTDSNFYICYLSLLSNRNFLKLLDFFGYSVIFYPHYEFQPYIHYFQHLDSDRIKIANKERFDVQTLLKESEILITDYSSVFFDFAYMNKSILFFQFDEEEYRQKHYAQGYFDYRKSFGPVCNNDYELIEELSGLLECNSIDHKYLEQIRDFFPLHDNNNCKRVYEEIIKL